MLIQKISLKIECSLFLQVRVYNNAINIHMLKRGSECRNESRDALQGHLERDAILALHIESKLKIEYKALLIHVTD